ncbi:uncharacterized protein LOC135219946 [Macrobrachium nipponense]|uniref:uncharacterized protein LOC135219946 n=1 Tax=Macrobrachium nipponense TaxID=159736 RepID=UPI0030C88732
MDCTTTTTTVSTPGYAAPPHLVYTQHVTTVTPSAAVQAPIAGFSRGVVSPPPGFAALTSAPDFRCPKSSALDLPPVPRMSLTTVPPPALSAVPAVPAAPAMPAAPARPAMPGPAPAGLTRREDRHRSHHDSGLCRSPDRRSHRDRAGRGTSSCSS